MTAVPKPKKKSAAAKKRATFARVFGPKERVEFVKSLPCVVRFGRCEGPIHNHHVKNGGAGRKANARFIVPLCQYHHGQLHLFGRRTFEACWGTHLETAAAETELKWQDHRAGSVPQQREET